MQRTVYSGLRLVNKRRFYCIVLPRCDGYSLCQQLRKVGNESLINMLIARDNKQAFKNTLTYGFLVINPDTH